MQSQGNVENQVDRDVPTWILPPKESVGSMGGRLTEQREWVAGSWVSEQFIVWKESAVRSQLIRILTNQYNSTAYSL